MVVSPATHCFICSVAMLPIRPPSRASRVETQRTTTVDQTSVTPSFVKHQRCTCGSIRVLHPIKLASGQVWARACTSHAEAKRSRVRAAMPPDRGEPETGVCPYCGRTQQQIRVLCTREPGYLIAQREGSDFIHGAGVFGGGHESAVVPNLMLYNTEAQGERVKVTPF